MKPLTPERSEELIKAKPISKEWSDAYEYANASGVLHKFAMGIVGDNGPLALSAIAKGTMVQLCIQVWQYAELDTIINGIDELIAMAKKVGGTALMEPKPLSKERREELEHSLSCVEANGNYFDETQVEELLAAEAYWRDVVKNAVLFGQCPFCHGFVSVTMTTSDFAVVCRPGTINHKPDCPWRLAQEPERKADQRIEMAILDTTPEIHVWRCKVCGAKSFTPSVLHTANCIDPIRAPSFYEPEGTRT